MDCSSILLLDPIERFFIYAVMRKAEIDGDTKLVNERRDIGIRNEQLMQPISFLDGIEVNVGKKAQTTGVME
jgi:hypothetical protein